jgi:hypothetical protein
MQVRQVHDNLGAVVEDVVERQNDVEGVVYSFRQQKNHKNENVYTAYTLF